jgi:superfamily II DNA or RNA helicase
VSRSSSVSPGLSLIFFIVSPGRNELLAAVRAGAVGINLTQANRVFLMEPSFNPALEKQAIGRVHRLGQKRCVEIIRLVTNNSVESRMLEFLEKKYGKSLGGSEKDSEGSDNKGPDEAKRPADLGQVGNVITDRATVMMDEFDLLFGVESLKIDEPEATASNYDAVADQVMSAVDL